MRPRLYVVELFAGTHSVSRAVRRSSLGNKFDVRVLSVDIDPKFNPSIVADISTWKYKGPIYDFLGDRRPKDVVALHASPPCTEFSRALTTRPRDLEAGSRNVKAAFRIIKYVDPHLWTLENPVGLLREQPFMKRYSKYLKTTCYCKFGFPYRKATNIWCNIPDLEDLPMCNAETPCAFKRDHGRHLVTAQAGSSGDAEGSGGGENVYGLPQKLVVLLFKRGLASLE